MNKQVPYATASDEKRIVDRLMCDGYSTKEIEAGFAVQAKDNGDFTVDSVRAAIRMIKQTTEWPKHSTEKYGAMQRKRRKEVGDGNDSVPTAPEIVLAGPA